MVTRDILNYVFGYVEFSAENGFCERFINSCTVNNIPLWDIRKTIGGLTAKTTLKGYRNIRIPSKKSSMKVKILKKSGLPFILCRFTKRKWLLSGFILAFCILLFLSERIWIIEVTGNENLTDREVIEAFEEAGLKIGSKTRKLELPIIESSAMLNLNNASWAAVNIRGCTAEINVRELKKVPEIETHSGTSNIIASKDGQITVIEVYRGTAAVKTYQPVLKGELLISGITESRLGTNLYTDAYGYVAAKTNITVQTKTPIKTIQAIPQEKKLWSVYFLGIEILPPKKNKENYYEHRSRLNINGKEIPFGINYRIYTTYEKKERTMNQAEAQLTAITEYALESYYSTNHAQIIEQSVTMEERDGYIEINGNYQCYENIGKSVPFEIEEIPDNKSPE